MHIVWISLFGLLGVLSRYGVDRALQSLSSLFPLGTLSVNILGCMISGVIWVLVEKNFFEPSIQVGLLVGFCGGFTTFSAFALQAMDLLQKERILAASLYLVGSPILGLLAALLGVTLTRRVL